MSAVLILALGTWLFISVLAQCRFTTANRLVYAVHSLMWRDYCGLIPSWSFFAPEPPVSDYRLLYRDQTVDMSFTPWQEVDTPGKPRVRGFWNPSMRRRKAVLDMCTRIDQLAGRARSRAPTPALFTSVPYRALLQQAINQPRRARGSHTQFMIARTLATGPHEPTGPEVVFISPLHAL